MGIYIRIDVDKPYGHKNIFCKILSKLSENYFTISYPKIYLRGCKKLLNFLNEQEVPANIYFRHSTIPDEEVKSLLAKGKHAVGLHAENTRNFDTFSEEFNRMVKKSEIQMDHFTKHGSGRLKLGKYHYPPYEPEKYKEWAKKMKLTFRFGNGTMTNANASNSEFIDDMFWSEHWYRDAAYDDMETLINDSKKDDHVLLIHPANYETFPKVKADFEFAIQKIKEHQIPLKII